jgi:hypothetical protein
MNHPRKHLPVKLNLLPDINLEHAFTHEFLREIRLRAGFSIGERIYLIRDRVWIVLKWLNTK